MLIKLSEIQPFSPPRQRPNDFMKYKFELFLDVSTNRGWAPQVVRFTWVFHYNPSILGYTPIFGNTIFFFQVLWNLFELDSLDDEHNLYGNGFQNYPLPSMKKTAWLSGATV